jgi:hypothetical protein
MIFKLIKVLAVGFFATAYLAFGLVFLLASIPWPGY